MSLLALILGPISGFLVRGRAALGIVQIAAFGLVLFFAPYLWWLGWLGCGVWSIAAAGSVATAAALQAQQHRIEELEDEAEARDD